MRIARLDRPRVWAGLLVVALACTACDDISAPGACTSRGCGLGNDTGLAIRLTGNLPAHYLIRIREHAVAIECTASSPCDPILFIPDITPSHVFVEVDAAGLDFEGDFAPTYHVTLPNGPGCGECRRGTITIAID